MKRAYGKRGFEKMAIRETKSRYAFLAFNYLFMIGMMVITLYPVLYVIFASFSGSAELVRNGGKILLHPIGFSLDAYEKTFSNRNVLTGYMNTIFVVVVGVTLSMIVSSIGAYFLSRKGVMLKKPITMLIMFTMFFSGGMIPTYMTVRDLHLVGSLWSLILPSLISTYNMIILRTGFESVPQSLEESAKIDGAQHIQILFHVILPLSKASLAVIALYYGVGYWNAWFNASLYLEGNVDKWPIQLVLRQILIVNDTNSMTQGVDISDVEQVGESIKYATIVVATVPILCVYPFIQRYFVKGVMIGAVKG